jgi:hypothetical protein
MQAALDDAGHELTALLTERPGWWDCATVVTDGQRHVQTVLGSQERWFLMEFWECGVGMAHGKTTDLAAAAGAIATWQAGGRLAVLREAWPFVQYGELAEAYERGNPTQARWQIFRRSSRWSHIQAAYERGIPTQATLEIFRRSQQDLIEAAYAQPALRMLFPFKSYGALNFSRCTRHPYSYDLPVIDQLADHRFTIFWPPHSPYGTGHIADAGTAAEAVAIVVAHLPTGCGPAIDGTAEDLDQLPP